MSIILHDETNLIDLNDRYKETVEYKGRTYQQYALLHEVYLAPIDGEEATRQERQHHMLKDIFDDWPHHRLYPLFIGEPRHILDCGFGTGAWAIDVATYDSDCIVTGVDITPHLALDDWPENLQLQIANLNDRSSFPNESFNFVHSRFVGPGIGRFKWPAYLTDIHRILRPGGWVQITEWDLTFRSNNQRTESLSALREWTRLYHASLDATGFPEGKKSTTVGRDCEAWLRTARFQQVRTDVRNVPTCTWAQDERLKRIGEDGLHVVSELLESLAVYPVTFRGICDIDRLKAIIEAAKLELARVESEPYIRLHTCWGMKEMSTGDS